MSATNRGAKRVPGDFYRTPSNVVRAILPHLPRHGTVLDPACGDGAILEVVAECTGYTAVTGYEIDQPRADVARERFFVAQRDSLGTLSWGAPGLVIMNPPFNLALEFVTRALSETRENGGTVAALLRLNWLASLKRATFHKASPSDVYVLSKRPSFQGGPTDATEYAWFCFGAGRGGRWQILDTEDGK